MNRKNTQISAILGIVLSALEIVSVCFLCGIILVYGLFFKGTPKGDSNVLTNVFVSIKFFSLLIAFAAIGFLAFMITYALNIYKTYNLTPLDYKNKTPLFKIYMVVQVLTYIAITTCYLLLCFKGAFNTAILSVIIIFLAICIILMFLHSYFINIDIMANNKVVKRDSVTNIKDGNFNQKYGLGEYANKTNITPNNKTK